ncbi:MAG: DUF3883 domain-containing protein [Chloroflexales bacterium]
MLSDGERWQLAWSAHHLLLLPAMPHMGKDIPYYYLWRLLEPDALATFEAFNAYPADARQRHFIRRVKECPVEYLLLLRGAEKITSGAIVVAATGQAACERARAYLADVLTTGMAAQRRLTLAATVEERVRFLQRGYDSQEIELAMQRTRFREKADAGDPRAKGELTKIKKRQRLLVHRREVALAVVRREPALVVPGSICFIAHALVVPSSDPEDRERYDADVEALAVKGRAGVGEVELKENEWAKACNLGDRYWLYVVFNCATPSPQLVRVQNPFHKLIAREKGGVLISRRQVLEAAEQEFSML